MKIWKIFLLGFLVFNACNTPLQETPKSTSPISQQNAKSDNPPLDLEFLPSPTPAMASHPPQASPAALPPCPISTASAPSPQNPVIELWPWGAKAALSFTLDEGVPEPYTILMPEFEVRGWKASFFVYTDQPFWEKAWEVILQAHLRGHEVSNHTKTHPNLTAMSDQEIHNEMRSGIEELRRQLGDENMAFPSFAYPYEATDDRTWAIVKQYHRYARSGDNGAPVPPNPVPINDARKPNWGALTAKAITSDYSLADWNSWVDATVKTGGWFIEELHGVKYLNKSGGWEPRTLEEFQAHFDHIEAYGEQLWIAPMGEVGTFIEERESAKIQLDHWGAQNIQLILTDAFEDEEAYDIPLTLKLPLPPNWQSNQLQAQQSGKILETRAAEPGYFHVAAYPNGQAVCIGTRP